MVPFKKPDPDGNFYPKHAGVGARGRGAHLEILVLDGGGGGARVRVGVEFSANLKVCFFFAYVWNDAIKGAAFQL